MKADGTGGRETVVFSEEFNEGRAMFDHFVSHKNLMNDFNLADTYEQFNLKGGLASIKDQISYQYDGLSTFISCAEHVKATSQKG